MRARSSSAKSPAEQLVKDIRHAGPGVGRLSCDQAHVHHRPRLLSDNGPSYIARELADYIEARAMSHVRGAPFYPQTQGKIERWPQTLKNRIIARRL